MANNVEVSQLHGADAPKRRFGTKTSNHYRGRPPTNPLKTLRSKWKWNPKKGEFVEREE